MSLQSLYGPSGLPQASPAGLRDSRETRSDVPFADLVKGLVKETDQQQQQAAAGVEKLVTGETDSIHDVVLTTSRADLAFRLMMEIRNRLIASYQEVMRMQI
jgi:flagellar hook-basal body complex protein FliE